MPAAGDPSKPRLLPLLVGCIMAQSTVALALAFIPTFHGEVSSADVFNDVDEYFDYSGRILRGQVPYRDFRVEYPPLALAVFLPARLVASKPGAYYLVFSVEMLLCNAACLLLAARWTAARRGAGAVPRLLAWYSAFFLLCNPTAMARYDLAVMLVTFGSALALSSGRPTLGGTLASASVLLKVFPGAVAGPAFLRELAGIRSSRPRALIASAVTFGVGVGAWVVVGGRDGVAAMLRYHTERGLEVGSLYAGIVAALARASGTTAPTAFNHLAQHIETPLALRLAALATPIQALAGLLALGAYWRSGFRDGLRYSTACLLAFIALGKVLSPQYLIWLIPFVACLGGRSAGRARAVFLVACGLSVVIYPYFFTWVAFLSGRGIVLLNLRNLALVGLYGLLVFGRPDEDGSPGVLESERGMAL